MQVTAERQRRSIERPQASHVLGDVKEIGNHSYAASAGIMNMQSSAFYTSGQAIGFSIQLRYRLTDTHAAREARQVLPGQAWLL